MVIAENGVGEGLPAYSLPAVTLAATRNVDYLELPLVMTGDDQLLVYPDITLNTLSGVDELFPGRKRADGNSYAIDLTLNEIRQLRLQATPETDPFALSFAIPTLKEQLGLLHKLSVLQNKRIGLVLEIKAPAFHRKAGKDISKTLLDTLALFGYTEKESNIYLQCCDADELQRIYHQLLPEKKMHLPLIQLIAADRQSGSDKKRSDYDWLFTNVGLRMVAGYATAIGLPPAAIADSEGNPLLEKFIGEAHNYGLKVLAYPVNGQKDQLPAFAADYSALLDFYFTRTSIDGIYTDSFAKVRHYQEQLAAKEKNKTDLPPFFSSLNLSRPMATAADTKND